MTTIDPKELRIGNLLWFRGDQEIATKVEVVSESSFLCEEGLGMDNFAYIPLTEKILLDSGFELTTDSMITYRKDDFSVKLVFDSKNCYVQFWHKSDWYDHKLIPCHETKYVHNLQNAYYMATGQELNIVIK